MIRRVRVYTGEDEASNVIGFNVDAWPKDVGRLAAFFVDRGYQFRQMGAIERPPDSTSAGHVEIRPPITPEHIDELGALCTGGVIAGEQVEALVDPGSDGVQVYDNRVELPTAANNYGGPVIA